jgi:uncharacterized protein YerC
MPNIARKNFNPKFKEEIWSIFAHEFSKGRSGIETVNRLRRFLTASEVAVLEKRLAAVYLLSHGESLRSTSEKSGLVKTSVVSVKHGFRKPIPDSRKRWSASSGKSMRKERYFPAHEMYHDRQYERWLNIPKKRR